MLNITLPMSVLSTGCCSTCVKHVGMHFKYAARRNDSYWCLINVAARYRGSFRGGGGENLSDILCNNTLILTQKGGG